MSDKIVMIDLETSGPRTDHVHVVQVGLLCPDPAGPLEYCGTWRLPAGAKLYDGAVGVHGLTRDYLEANGTCPLEGLRYVRRELASRAETHVIAGQNLYGFDLPVLKTCFERVGLTMPKLPYVFDSGVAIKAYQLSMRKEHGGWDEFFEKVRRIRAKGVKWSVDWCSEQLGLEKRSGDHNALEDCRKTLEIIREADRRGVYKEVGWEWPV